jgi:photosystem II stability/assembly factor-like uncharacterized protein
MKKILYIIFSFFFIGTLSAQSNFWTPQAIGILPSNYTIIAISVVNKDIVWGLADTLLGNSTTIPANTPLKVIKTTNGGTTWSVFDVTPGVGRFGVDIHAFDTTTAFVTVQALRSATNNNLYKTIDGGKNWISIIGNSYAPSAFIRYFDAQNAIIWNRHASGRSTDGGVTWSPGSVTGWLSTEGMGWSSTSNVCTVVGDTIWSGTTNARVVFSTDKGINWRFTDLKSMPNFTTDVTVFGIAFRDARNGIVMGWNSVTFVTYLARTTDGGQTWSPLTTYPFTLGSGIEYIKGTPGSFIVNDYEGLTAYTKDFGQTWVKLDSLNTNSIRFLNPQTGWIGREPIVAGGPAMYKWNGGNILSSIKVFEADEIGLKMSPNPTSRYLNIEYSEDFKPISLTVYDAQGKAVFQKNTLLQTAQNLDLQTLPNGIHLVQLRNTEGYVSKEIIVQR